MGLKAVASSGSAATGDIVGPSSSTDNAVARFDGTTGKLLQNSVVTIGDTGNIQAGVAGTTVSINYGGNGALISGDSSGRLSLKTNGNFPLFMTGNTLSLDRDTIIGHSATTNQGSNPDVAFSRISAGLEGLGTGAQGSFAGSLKLTNLIAVGAVQLGTFTVATLPSAATYPGGVVYVTDALTTMALGLGTAIAAGGSNKTTGWSDGTNFNYG